MSRNAREWVHSYAASLLLFSPSCLEETVNGFHSEPCMQPYTTKLSPLTSKPHASVLKYRQTLQSILLKSDIIELQGLMLFWNVPLLFTCYDDCSYTGTRPYSILLRCIASRTGLFVGVLIKCNELAERANEKRDGSQWRSTIDALIRTYRFHRDRMIGCIIYDHTNDARANVWQTPMRSCSCQHYM